jgi:hypothetical protein
MGNSLTTLVGVLIGYTLITVLRFAYNLFRANNW